MSVTFFNSGLTVSDNAALRADAFCEAHMLSFYRRANNGENPPGWPNPLGHRNLIEWSIKHLFAHSVRDWERRTAIQNLEDPSPWEGQGIK